MTAKILQHKAAELWRQNSLFSNSLNLMMSTAVTALFGFVFWTLVARSFNSVTVGLATTLLSMSSLLSWLGLVGFDTVFVRFLPKATRRSEQIDNGMILSGIGSAVIAAVFCVLIPLVSPKLSFVDHNLWYVLSFVLFTVLATWNILTNAALIAYRRTSFVVVINIIFSTVKMVLPLLIPNGGPMTIFNFMGLAQVVNVALSIAVLIKYFDYRPTFRVHLELLRDMRRYGMAVYVSQVLNLLPTSVLPLIVVNELGATAAAYFYIAMTIATLLYTVAFSTGQALLAETAHDDETQLLVHLRKGLTLSAALMVPLVVLIIAVCPFILGIFGDGYEQGATGVLRLMAVGGLTVMLGSLASTTFKQTKQLRAILTAMTVNALATISLSLILVQRYGLLGIGWALLLGGCLTVAVEGAFIFKTLSAH
jgi:O-antigen/teichoic acid export membrane protein